jgi:hypothetical protein
LTRLTFVTKIRGVIRNFVFFAGITDTGGKQFTGVLVTGGKLLPVSYNPFFLLAWEVKVIEKICQWAVNAVNSLNHPGRPFV